MSKGNMEALKLVLSETRSLFHHMKLLAEDSYQQESLSGGNRGILHDLACMGPQSPAQLTNLRPLSRIHIEDMIEPLESHGYISQTGQLDENNQPMVELTDKGRRYIQSSDKRELEILTSISNSVPREEMLIALDVLRAIRKSFDGDLCKRISELKSQKMEKAAG
ncbi:MAG: hypothetical protein OEV92_03295 [Nitrospinota bacterium]|nr:hypothetical protein [Nitrospinota bacterium]